jgi:hypothetical protein
MNYVMLTWSLKWETEYPNEQKSDVAPPPTIDLQLPKVSFSLVRLTWAYFFTISRDVTETRLSGADLGVFFMLQYHLFPV